jgi:glycosidase
MLHWVRFPDKLQGGHGTDNALGGLHTKAPDEVEPYSLPEAKAALKRTQDYITHPLAWASVFKENHDMPRSVSRHGTTNPRYWAMAAKLLAMMTGTLSGTLYLYQGEEIGMTNIPDTWSEKDLKDIASLNVWDQYKKTHAHDKAALAKFWKALVALSRDNARTPVQWSGEANAGFTTGTPWMRVNENYKLGINVADELESGDSVLSFWKRVLQVRKQYPDLFVHGAYQVHDFDNKQTWTFEKRSKHGGSAWVVLNFSEDEADVDVPKHHAKLVLSNNAEPGKRLKPFEGRVYLQK